MAEKVWRMPLRLMAGKNGHVSFAPRPLCVDPVTVKGKRAHDSSGSPRGKHGKMEDDGLL